MCFVQRCQICAGFVSIIRLGGGWGLGTKGTVRKDYGRDRGGSGDLKLGVKMPIV